MNVGIFLTIEIIVKTSLYFVLALLGTLAVNERDSRKVVTNGGNFHNIVIAICMSLLYCLYSLLSASSYNISDRERYGIRFENNKMETWTVGLRFIGENLRKITTNKIVLYIFVAFVSTYLLFYTISSVKEKKSIAVYMILMSHVELFAFYAFKQALSMAFINLAFKEYIENKKFRCIGFILLGVLFHEAAYIMIPVFLLLLFTKNNKSKFGFSMLIIVIIITFPISSIIIVKGINSYFPTLYIELVKNNYLNSLGGIGTSLSVATIVKGIPIYLIAIFSVYFRRELVNKIERYDDYMCLSIIAATIYFSSLYMYWMVRFSFYFYFIIFIYWSNISDRIRKYDNKQQTLCNSFVVGSLTFFTLRFLYITYQNFGGF